MHNRYKDYEDRDEGDAAIVNASCARMRVFDISCSLRQQILYFARRRTQTRRENETISQEESDVAASAVSFVDVLAYIYTAYSDDRDDGVNDDRQVCCERKIDREEIYNEHKKNDSDVYTNVSNNLCDKHEHKNTNKNVSRQDYIYTEVNTISHCILQDNQWISPSSSFDRKLRIHHYCEYERIDDYNYENPTKDENFGQKYKKKEECSERKCDDNTAWFQKPIIRRKRGGERKRERSEEREGILIERSHIRKSYYKLLLFMLYLLAWPLLCSTSSSGHLASTFAQNPILVHAKNSAHRENVTPSDTLLSSTVIVHQYQQYVQDSDHNTDNSIHYQRYHQEQKQQQQWQQQKQKQQLQQWQQQQQEKKEKREQPLEQEEEWQHPYNEYIWEVNQMNPWLSACDLAGPAPADLQGSCGPPEVPKHCPVSCDNVMTSHLQRNDIFREVIKRGGFYDKTTTMTTMGMKTRMEIEDSDESNRHRRYYTKQKKEGKKIKEQKKKSVRTAPEQCLFYLEKSHKEDICRNDFGQNSMQSFLTPRENRYWFMSGLRLRHCCEHTVVNALAPGKGGPLEDVLNGGRKCADALDKLLYIDALAARLHCEFEEVLARYDCAQPYSVIHNCTHCKEAYRKWVCSSLVPYFAHGGPMNAETPEDSWTGTRLRSCRSFCQSVEQRCPYLLPGDRAPAYPTQYAGEPTFLCGDPNIPETGVQAARALHNNDENECCFYVCSEDAPESGICTNCTESKHSKMILHDLPTAPQCENNPSQSGFTGQQYPGSQAGQLKTSTDRGFTGDDNDQRDSNISPSLSSTLTSSIIIGQQETSFCGSGRIGSISSASSLGRSNPSIVLQFFWLYLILVIFFPVNTLRCNIAFWYFIRFLQLVDFRLTFWDVLNAKKILDDIRVVLASRLVRIYQRIVEQYFLFIFRMPKRTIIKCHCRDWWWRFWRRCSSRHFRWKFRLKMEHHSRTCFHVRLHVLDKGTIVPENYLILTNCLRRFPMSLHRFTRILRFQLVIVIHSRISKKTMKNRQLKKKMEIMYWRSRRKSDDRF